jgi:ATP-dependent Clp protease ATP-binding subunit ClpC
MQLIDRFSTHLKDVLARAIHLATELKNPFVEPIHLLFALLNQKGSVASELLNRHKISAPTLEQALLSLPTTSEGATRAVTAGADQATLTPLSSASKVILEKAMSLAHEHNHSHMGTEHLLAAIVESTNDLVVDVLKVNGVKTPELVKQIHTVLGNAQQFPALDEAAEMADRLEENLGDILPPGTPGHQHPPAGGKNTPVNPPAKKRRKDESALDFFAVHLTDPELQKDIDPLIGRASEVERVIQILCRRTKNNPLLLGEPGVGKTAIVEGLAKRILAGDVPEPLLGKKIYGLDMGLLIAGTVYRGEFEGRLRQVVEEVSSDENIILFIDEVHNIVGAGSNQGTMDAANLLKPALARGEIRCIGATTPGEFKKFIESDAALERRFQSVFVKEPNVADAITILKGIKKNYETYHHVHIEDAAVEAAARLSERYITGKHLPDKAIDLLDETAAAKRLASKPSAAATKLAWLNQKLEQTISAKEHAAHTDAFVKAVELKKKEEALREDIKKLTTSQSKKRERFIGTVTASDVTAQVAKIIGTKPSELIIESGTNLETLENDLKRSVIGQDEAIHEVAALVGQAQLGLSKPERPLASFLFVGESGVGKTELAKQLAVALYHDPAALIKLDMSEFNESFSVSKLLGSPAGYVGYKESNQFTDKLKMHPYAVVLFDEIDKAHKDVVRLLLQILENGEITDATGKPISLRHSIVVLTTSFGADEVKKQRFGFGDEGVASKDTKARVLEKLKEHFSPEIINRLDQICLFNPLSTEVLHKIAELEIKSLNERLVQYHTELTANDTALEWIIKQLPAGQLGARDVRRTVRKEIERLMAELVLKKTLKSSYRLQVAGKFLVVR